MAFDKDKYVSAAMQLEAQQKEIERLKWEIERLRDHWQEEKLKNQVYKQLDDANKGLIYAILQKVGATEEEPLRVSAQTMAEARAKNLEANSGYDVKTDEYLMFVR